METTKVQAIIVRSNEIGTTEVDDILEVHVIGKDDKQHGKIAASILEDIGIRHYGLEGESLEEYRKHRDYYSVVDEELLRSTTVNEEDATLYRSAPDHDGIAPGDEVKFNYDSRKWLVGWKVRWYYVVEEIVGEYLKLDKCPLLIPRTWVTKIGEKEENKDEDKDKRCRGRSRN